MAAVARTDTPPAAPSSGLQLRDGFTEAEWYECGRKLGRLTKVTPWLIGDWLRAGETNSKVAGVRFDYAVGVTGLERGTLHTYSSVAGKFPPARRHDRLSLSHHQLVGMFDDEEADEWLDRAEADRWTVATMRDRLEARRLQDSRRQRPELRKGLAQSEAPRPAPARLALVTETTTTRVRPPAELSRDGTVLRVPPSRVPAPRTERIVLKVTAERADRWRAAADRAGRRLDGWLGDVADGAAAPLP